MGPQRPVVRHGQVGQVAKEDRVVQMEAVIAISPAIPSSRVLVQDERGNPQPMAGDLTCMGVDPKFFVFVYLIWDDQWFEKSLNN